MDRARPVLDVLGARVFHLGDLGAGATMKLAVNAVVHALNQALAEALVLAERAGVDRAKAYEVFAASAIAAPFVHYKQAAFLDPAGTPVAFMLDLVAKDLALIEDLAAEVGRAHGAGGHEPVGGAAGPGRRVRRARPQRARRVPPPTVPAIMIWGS